MPQAILARVTCPNCNHQFQTPVEQILDVRADPGAKVRVLNGLVNVASCPHCGAAREMGLPFLYHDPDKELALIYMPMQAGRTDIERQQAIGKLTSTVMDNLPPEERKAYLLQPQVFLTMENLVNKILEADGVTPEMIEEQKAKAELLRRMFDVTSDEALEVMVKENDSVIDKEFFNLLAMNIEMAQAGGQAIAAQKLLALRNQLLDWSSEGRAIKARNEVLETFRAEPTREKLLELLVQTSDEQTRELLITFGRPALDYPFFQSLTAQIESASDADEKERLTALRAQVLEIRDRLDEMTRALYEERSTFLRDLLLSDDPEALARRRFQELDQVFFNVLTTNLEKSRSTGDTETFKALQAIWGLVLHLIEETLPPEIQLFNRLIAAKDEAELDKLLQENHDLVTEHLVQFIEGAEDKLKAEEGKDIPETTERIASILEKVRGMVISDARI
ncbi:MAG: hypothetical protein DRI77_07430 [Chloroflexi bacterium]|nr:MAG: hypothetical protein DRI77_07430 [Chloroflexota bacterium]